MLSKHLLIGALAATTLSISGANAAVIPIVWNFGDPSATASSVPGLGNLGHTVTQFSSPLDIGITGTAWSCPGNSTSCLVNPNQGVTSHSIFRKDAGGGEAGWGITGRADNEITPGSWIQLSLSNLHSPPLVSTVDLTFAAGSVTSPDEWAVFGTNAAAGANPAGATFLESGFGEGDVTINTMGFSSLQIRALAGTVLVRQLDASAIPEPSTWAMMILGFAGLGFLGYRRRAKVGRLAQVF